LQGRIRIAPQLVSKLYRQSASALGGIESRFHLNAFSMPPFASKPDKL